MAKKILEETLSAQTRWDIATLINRVYPYPLDPTTLFSSRANAEDYARNSGNAYVGQVISVVDGENVSLFQIKDEDGSLQEFVIDNPQNSIDDRLSKIEQYLENIKNIFGKLGKLEKLEDNSSFADLKTQVNTIVNTIIEIKEID